MSHRNVLGAPRLRVKKKFVPCQSISPCAVSRSASAPAGPARAGGAGGGGLGGGGVSGQGRGLSFAGSDVRRRRHKEAHLGELITAKSGCRSEPRVPFMEDPQTRDKKALF